MQKEINPFLLDPSEFQTFRRLGKGSFGDVFSATYRDFEVAMKQMLLEDDEITKELLEEFEGECEVMAKLSCPFIVDFLGYFLEPKPTIILQFMPKGSLRHVLEGKSELTWPQRIKMATDISKGLTFLHQKNILHLDLKSMNVLVDDCFNAKICDFGLVKIKENIRTSTASKETKPESAVGTPAWMAPELFDLFPKYSTKSDIYALGTIFWEIYSRKTPFSKVVVPSLIPMLIMQGKREVIGEDCPEVFAAIIKESWEKDPELRPTAEEIVERLAQMEHFGFEEEKDTPERIKQKSNKGEGSEAKG